MEISVELDGDLIEELDDEAGLQGFDDRGAYLRWIIAHRPMSDLASTEAPAVATRVSELEERVKLLERQLDLDGEVDPENDLASGSASSLDASGASGPDLGSDGPSLGDGLDSDAETVDLDEPDAEPEPEPDEDAAADDDIAEAIDDVSLDEDE